MLPAFARIAVLLVMAPPTPTSPTPATAPTPAERFDAVHFDWVMHGRALREHSPKTLKRASALGQLDYLAEQTADRLCILGITPNYDQAGRDRAQRKFNDSSLGACGHTALCLKKVLCGAGLPEKCCKTLVVLKKTPNGDVPLEINADHAALVYLHPDGPVVFDLWCDGRTQNTFANFRTSIWKGMPAGEWGRRMLLEGYTVASVQEHSELGETSPLQLTQLLQKLQEPPAQAGR